MRAAIRICLALLLMGCIGCQPTGEAPAPTLTAPASVTPRPALALVPTQTPRAITTALPTLTRTPYPTPTRWRVVFADDDAPPSGTLDPAFLTQIAVRSESAAPLPLESGATDGDAILIGRSVEGRAIAARAFGSGDRVLLLVGGMHGGWEANTVRLVDELITHFEQHPQDVLPGMRLVLVSAANPDGLLRGRTPEGRFNTNGVDLNRNWGCDWSPDAVWRTTAVSPGAGAFSEPETQALAAFIRQTRPVAALFYHSAAGGIFAGYCRGDHGSAAVSGVLGEATGYESGEAFTAYEVSGTAASWADSEGIAAADVELLTWTDSEFERNLRGIMALQAWLTGVGRLP